MHKITIRISNPEELFRINEIKAFELRENFEPGFDHIYHTVSAINPTQPLSIIVKLTTGGLSGEMHDVMSQNIKSFCNEKVQLLEIKKRSKRKNAMSTVVKGLMIMVACLTAAYFIEEYLTINKSLKFIIAEGLKIWAWISLWPTGEILLFEQWNFNHQVKVYKTILDAKIVVE